MTTDVRRFCKRAPGHVDRRGGNRPRWWQLLRAVHTAFGLQPCSRHFLVGSQLRQRASYRASGVLWAEHKAITQETHAIRRGAEIDGLNEYVGVKSANYFAHHEAASLVAHGCTQTSALSENRAWAPSWNSNSDAQSWGVFSTSGKVSNLLPIGLVGAAGQRLKSSAFAHRLRWPSQILAHLSMLWVSDSGDIARPCLYWMSGTLETCAYLSFREEARLSDVRLLCFTARSFSSIPQVCVGFRSHAAAL